MGILEAIELCGCLLEVIDVGAIVGALFAFEKGKPNRRDRKSARAAGASPPRLDRWNLLWAFLLPVAFVLTAAVFWKWVKWAGG